MFVSIDEKYIKRYNKKKGLKYFKKRRLIGNVLTDVKKININFNLLKKRRKFHNIEINKIKKEIYYLGKSKKRLGNLINNI